MRTVSSARSAKATTAIRCRIMIYSPRIPRECLGVRTTHPGTSQPRPPNQSRASGCCCGSWLHSHSNFIVTPNVATGKEYSEGEYCSAIEIDAVTDVTFGCEI